MFGFAERDMSGSARRDILNRERFNVICSAKAERYQMIKQVDHQVTLKQMI
jgi:hypothetical protein